MTRRVATLPERYDAEIVAKEVDRAIRNTQTAQAPASNESLLTSFSHGGGRIRLKLQSQVDSTLLLTENDPRLLYCSGVEGELGDRFRLEAPIDFCPWVVYCSQSTAATNLWTPVVWFQKLLVNIPHGLGRVPERLVDQMRPKSHTFRVTRYPTTASKGVWQVGDTVRAYVDVHPLFASTIEDMNRELAFLVGTLGGAAVNVDGGYNWQHFVTGGSAPAMVRGGNDATTGLDFHAGLPGQLLATAERFSAIVSVCAWGNPAKRSEISGSPGGNIIYNPGFRDFFGYPGERNQEYRELNLLWPLPHGRVLSLVCAQAVIGATVSIYGTSVCDGTVTLASLPNLGTLLTGADAITLTWEQGALDFIIA